MRGYRRHMDQHFAKGREDSEESDTEETSSSEAESSQTESHTESSSAEENATRKRKAARSQKRKGRKKAGKRKGRGNKAKRIVKQRRSRSKREIPTCTNENTVRPPTQFSPEDADKFRMEGALQVLQMLAPQRQNAPAGPRFIPGVFLSPQNTHWWSP